MSDVVEKTLTALPSLLSLDSQPGSAKLSSSSKLGGLIRGITELTSKHVSLSLKPEARWKGELGSELPKRNLLSERNIYTEQKEIL